MVIRKVTSHYGRSTLKTNLKIFSIKRSKLLTNLQTWPQLWKMLWSKINIRILGYFTMEFVDCSCFLPKKGVKVPHLCKCPLPLVSFSILYISRVKLYLSKIFSKHNHLEKQQQYQYFRVWWFITRRMVLMVAFLVGVIFLCWGGIILQTIF